MSYQKATAGHSGGARSGDTRPVSEEAWCAKWSAMLREADPHAQHEGRVEWVAGMDVGLRKLHEPRHDPYAAHRCKLQGIEALNLPREARSEPDPDDEGWTAWENPTWDEP